MKQMLVSMCSRRHGEPLSTPEPEIVRTGTAVRLPREPGRATDEEQYQSRPKPTVFVSTGITQMGAETTNGCGCLKSLWHSFP